MRIGIPRESRPGETLVAATAKTAGQLLALGYEVVVETGAGEAADQPDAAYQAAGVRVVSTTEAWSSDVVVKVAAPTEQEVALLRPEATLVALLAPARTPELLSRLQAAGVTALAMDAVPRISRAQSMDVLSSMANVAGYRAVIEAAHEFGRQFTGQVTAAGKVPPARVFVVGAGVAGLAAVGAAGSLGAVVRAFDVRPEVGEQVESMGAEFVTVEMEQQTSSDGYAKEMTAAQQAATAAMYDEEARAADIVITTALIPGRRAPRLITAETVRGMRPGSVIVDMAAGTGGNVELTQPDEKVVVDGVKVLGYTDLAGRLAAQTSQLYGTNIVNLFKLLTPAGDGRSSSTWTTSCSGASPWSCGARRCGRRRRCRSAPLRPPPPRHLPRRPRPPRRRRLREDALSTAPCWLPCCSPCWRRSRPRRSCRTSRFSRSRSSSATTSSAAWPRRCTRPS